jgi:IS30 family transposase
MHNDNNNHTFKIEERRRQVASLLAQSRTESEIAELLNVDQSTISRDIKALKEISQQFIFDLAKSDLAYYYKQSIDGIEEAKKEAWRIYNNNNDNDKDSNNIISTKEKLAGVKLIIESNEARFKLLSEGPSVLAMKSLEERLSKIENHQVKQQQVN